MGRSTTRPRRGQAHPASRRATSASADVVAHRRHRARPARDRGCWRRGVGRGSASVHPRPRVVRPVHRHRAGRRTGTATASRPDLRRPTASLLAAAVARGRRRRRPCRARSATTTPKLFAAILDDQLLAARDLDRHHRRRQRGRVRRGQGGAVAAGHGRRSRKVAMQPGKPQGFGTVGPDSTPIITLPGNPVSAFVSFEVFVRPMIRLHARRRDAGTVRWSVRSLRRRAEVPGRSSGSTRGGWLDVEDGTATS